MRPMKTAGVLLLSTLAAACAPPSAPEEVVTTRSGALTAGALDAVLTVNSDWGTGYCAEIRVTNHTAAPVSDWAVGLDIKQSAISNSWNANFTSTGGSTYAVTALPSDPILWGSSTISVGFCGTSAQGGAAYRPVLTSVTCGGGACSGGTGSGGASGGGGGGASGGGGNVTAQKVFGQPTLGDTVVNQIVANRTFHPQGVAIQRNATSTPDRVFVVDSGNQRILGFRALGTCSNQTTKECTNNGECTSPGTCVITGTRNADIAIGQPSLTTGTCNGDNSRSMPPTASTLCFQPYPRAISLLESPDTINIALDSSGSLYVPDKWNHRVLKYNDPFGTDRVADFVWGQADFTSRACNQGLQAPTKSTLCLNSETTQIHISGDQEAGGVDVSPDGKVWVTDQGNGRLLRFPANSKDADLVIGQPDFTTGTRDPNECSVGGTNTGSRLCFPKAVRYDATNNKVYVLDWKGSGGLDGNNAKYRVLIYQAPFSNGMAATEIITGTSIDIYADPPITSCWTTGSEMCVRRPTGIELAPGVTNAFWMADAGFSRALYIDKSTGSWKQRKVLSQSNLSQFGDDAVTCSTGNSDDCHAQHPGGGIGIDSAGNVYLAETGNARVMRFPPSASIPDAPATGGTAVAATAQLFPIVPGQYGVANYNKQSGAGFIAAHVVRMANYPNGTKQMLVRDAWRVLFWNGYDQTSVVSGVSADGVLFQPNLASNAPNDQAPDHIADIDFDAQGHVYVAVADRVDMFQGPLVTGQQPLASVHLSNIPFALNQGTTGDVQITGMAWQASTSALFVADNAAHRILRVANPFSGSPTVNLVLGQRGANNRRANRDRDDVYPTLDCFSVQPDSFASLGELRFDKLGNLYITDTSHEGWQCSNNRILEYDAAALNVDAAHPFFCGVMDATYDDTPAELADPARQTCGTPRPARRVYGPPNFTSPEWNTAVAGQPTFPFAVTFDAQNRMILSVDAYGNLYNERVYYYANPVPTCNQSGGCAVPATAIFGSTHAQPASVSFDSSGNLAILDHTWNRVLFYKAADVTSWIAAH